MLASLQLAGDDGFTEPVEHQVLLGCVATLKQARQPSRVQRQVGMHCVHLGQSGAEVGRAHCSVNTSFWRAADGTVRYHMVGEDSGVRSGRRSCRVLSVTILTQVVDI